MFVLKQVHIIGWKARARKVQNLADFYTKLGNFRTSRFLLLPSKLDCTFHYITINHSAENITFIRVKQLNDIRLTQFNCF